MIEKRVKEAYKDFSSCPRAIAFCVLMKTFFNLQGAYEGLRARRLAQCGSLWFVRVINDGAPYWLVQIRNFVEGSKNRSMLCAAGSNWGNGSFRFTDFGRAKEKYRLLSAMTIFQTQEQKREAQRQIARERMQKLRE